MSEVKVNKISPRTNCGTVTLGDSGDSFSVAACASFKTKDVKDTSGNIIISRCGSNITIGSSGASVALASGATQSGFGASGAVSWNTTKITADPNPAVSGVGYFADTTSSAFTVTLPAAPSAGAIIGIRDYAQTFATNNLTVGRNSQPIDGISEDLVLSTNGIAVTLVYVDATQGWKSINSNEVTNVLTPVYIVATGGTITCDGDYKIHTFTGPGTFTVCSVGNPAGSDTVDYLVVAGGGSGGGSIPGGPVNTSGGGGGGGYRESVPSPAAWTASPLANPGGALPVSAQGYPITVGGGASNSGGNSRGPNGSPSIFSTITSAGGGAGGRGNSCGGVAAGTDGGSGGGQGTGSSVFGSGNTPPTSPPQGQPGGGGPGISFGSGGGGATVAGVPNASGGAGGTGATSSINATPTGRSGGGGGGGGSGGPGAPPAGGTATQGGGAGGPSGGNAGSPGTTNTGGGGGGNSYGPGCSGRPGSNGGSGIVILRYKYQ